MRTLAHLIRAAAVLALPLALAAASSGPALAVQQAAYRMEILVDGVPLEEYAARGKRYVEAHEGREYSIRLTNPTARRVAVALSVDGLNTIDARTTSARSAAKWILDPHQTITLDGWQTGTATARRFYFTTEERSYGAWLGKTSNLGTISAAFFRERARPVSEPVPYREGLDDGGATGRPDKVEKRSEAERRDAGERSAAAPSRKSAKRSADAVRPEEPDDLAATGIGRKVEHRVRRVPFEAEGSPAAVLSLRYEYHDALVGLGVLPRPWPDDRLDRRERARGFDDFEFAPDPYRD